MFLELELSSCLGGVSRDRMREGESLEDYKKFGYLSGRIMGNDMSGARPAHHLGVMICIPTFGATGSGHSSQLRVQ